MKRELVWHPVYLELTISHYLQTVFTNGLKLSPYAEIWKGINSKANISLTSTVEDAFQMAKDIGDRGRGMQTFVTGDTGLIGIGLNLLVEDNINISKV